MLFIQVSKKNIMDIIKKLMVQIDKADSQSESLQNTTFLIIIQVLGDTLCLPDSSMTFVFIVNLVWFCCCGCFWFTAYCDEILSKIIQICSMNDYHYVTNFEW